MSSSFVSKPPRQFRRERAEVALLKAGIPCLTGRLASEPLVDASGKLAGVVIANRSGRQAIRAKVLPELAGA